ncbi:osteopetrosis-associated transmembrane protein 1 isoform X2 [Octopus sinensis]|uniref:Osteopetrosis-associated transmembrane protein 1 isoform X2 n=1 Tax=Octopus sinensis TaxID=2607531 RepID=A0A7E6ENB5_9MOLL|nr:osteopetrosis-associated transmembrane protein 1 isoform X2 [Octopus sinensis]
MERNLNFITVIFLLILNNFLLSSCNEGTSWTSYHTQNHLPNNDTLAELSQTNSSTVTATTSEATTRLETTTIEPVPIKKPCEAIIGNISNVVSKFYRCSIERARPYRFCTECLQDYKAAIDLYSDIASASKNSTLVICKNLLMKSDYAPLIPSVFQDIETLWSSAYCSSCYSVTEDKVELNNKTVKFIDSYKEMIACFENNTLNQMNICQACIESYKKLNSDFRTIEDYSSPSICMDVMDMMNYTRLLWSQDCPTKNRQDNTVLTVSVSVSLIIITVIYYVCMYLIGKGKLFNFCHYNSLSNNSNSLYRSISDIPGINTPSASSQR